MYTKSPTSFFADCSILSLITMRQKIAIRTEFIGLMSIVVLALGMMFMPVLSMAEQVEPTVSCNEGSEPTALTYGDHTAGCVIDPPTDLDRFDFCGTMGDDVRLNVLSLDHLDPSVEIRDPMFGLVAQGSCNEGCSFTLDFSLPVNGCYTIFTSDLDINEIGNYTLQLELILPVISTAVHIDYDKSESNPVSDTISPATDIDFFTFNATTGTDIRLNVLSLDHLDPTVEIRDPNGIVVMNGVADGATCNEGCSFSLDLSPSVTGTYSLIIYDRDTNETGGYNLSLWCLAGPCDGIPDPAGPLISYVTPIADTINPAVDGDFFTFNATTGTDIRLNVLSLDHLDPTVEIRDPNGTVIVNGVANGATCDEGCSFSLDLSPSVSGTYSLIIYDKNINETGSYELSLWCLWGDCDSDADGLPDGDPQVSFNTPAVLSYGLPVDDFINPAVDSDVLVFEGTASDLIRLNVLSLDHLDPTVEIRDPNGTVVVNGVADGATCDEGCSFSLDLSPSVSGTYSLIIYDKNINETGSYQIGLQCLVGTCTDAIAVCGDNCIDIANPDQRDTNGDGYGNICDPDLDNDLLVNVADLALLKSVFFRPDPDADLNGDGIVQFADLAIMKKFFFQPPGPSCVAP